MGVDIKIMKFKIDAFFKKIYLFIYIFFFFFFFFFFCIYHFIFVCGGGGGVRMCASLYKSVL